MGNITDRIAQYRYELGLTAVAATLVASLRYQSLQNRQLWLLAHALDPEVQLASENERKVVGQLTEKLICDELLEHKRYPIYRVALTGGPCAGKSTALEQIEKHFSASGFKVLTVPEVPTIVGMGGGLSDFGRYGPQERIQFQTDIVKLKIYFEDYIAKLAEMCKQPCLILCDRGLADCAAYMAAQEYQALLDEQGWTWSNIRDRRYDSVIFMNTAAIGAQEFYTLANNSARSQTPEQARALDKKTLNSWIGHPYMTICPNIKGKPFKYKVGLAIKAVQKTIGIESTEVIYHKFLVDVGRIPDDVVAVNSDIEQVYLRNQNPRYVQDKIKKRGQDNSFTYQRKYVSPYRPQQAFREVMRVSLNSLQYATLQQEQADPTFRPIHIKRINFEWNSTYFALDEHDHIANYPQAKLLRFETGRDRDVSEVIPPWISIIKDVRGHDNFTLSRIAQRQY